MEKILVVVDMQNDFIDGSLGSEQAKSIVGRVAEKIRNFDGEVYVTFDTHYENYPETSEGKKLPVSHCIENTYGWKLNNDIRNAVAPKDYVLIKKNTFGSTDLADHIKMKYGDKELQVEMVGVCTDICVIANAIMIKTFIPECEITVDSSCCAGVTPESHEAALKVMKSCLINVI